MAKNTGRGSRVVQLDPHRHAFIDAKRQGGTFRGVRRRRNPLRFLSRIEFFPFGLFGIFLVLNITFQIITFSTGMAHYEVHSLFDYTYTLNMGDFHYTLHNGINSYGN